VSDAFAGKAQGSGKVVRIDTAQQLHWKAERLAAR
jgi:hypothetical protein